MVRGDQRTEIASSKGVYGQARIRNRTIGDRDIDLVGDYHVMRFARVIDSRANFDHHIWVLARNVGQDVVDKTVDETIANRNHYLPGTQVAQSRQRIRQIRIQALLSDIAFSDQVTRFGESHMATLALYEPHPQLMLQTANLSADHGRRNVEVFGSSPDSATAGHFVQVSGAFVQ